MEDREHLQQQMLELIYGLLSDEESAELVDRISSNGQLARDYAELKEKTELLAEVTRSPAPAPDFEAWKRAAADKHPVSPRSGGSTWTVRTWQVVSALAACLLIAALAYPPLAINPRQQTAVLTESTQRLADDYLSLSVIGPSLMATEVRNEFFVSVENAANQPVDAKVEYWFKSPTNETVYYGLTESKDGQVVCQIPADEVSSASRLEVVAQRGEVKSTLGLAVQAAPPKPYAVLQTDRDFAEPGQTVNFRAVVLDPQTQQERSANVDFLWSMQDGRQLNRVANAERSTLKGVALGNLTVPANENAQNLELALESPELQNHFQQRMLAYSNLGKTGDNMLGQTRAYEDAPAAVPAPTQLAAKPEGGSLVAGVENRLLFLSQNNVRGAAPAMRAQRRSANVDGAIGDVETGYDAIGNGIPAQQELLQEVDFGAFKITPEASQQYTLEVANDGQPPLQQQSFEAKQLPATFQINNGVALSNEPLDIDVRVAMPNTTMALVAGDDNATLGYHLWDVGVNAPITQPVQLKLPTEATGAQRVRLFSVPTSTDADADASQSPQLLAERVVYRIPVHRFAIELAGLPPQATPGEQLNLSVAVNDEFGAPAPATLGIQMHRLPDVPSAQQQPLGLEGEFLLNQRVVLPQSLVGLPEDVRLLEQDRVYFDQVLALSDWRKQPTPAAEMLEMANVADLAGTEEAVAAELPVVRRSNKQSVQSKYQEAIAAVQLQWQARMEEVRQTSRSLLVIGGAILAVGLIGLALVQGRRKIAIWAPGLVVAFGSVLWGFFSAGITLQQFGGPLSSPEQMVAVSDEAKLRQQETIAANELDSNLTLENRSLTGPKPQVALSSEAESLAAQPFDAPTPQLPAKPQVQLRTNSASNEKIAEADADLYKRTDGIRVFRNAEGSGGYGGAIGDEAAGRDAYRGAEEANTQSPLRVRSALAGPMRTGPMSSAPMSAAIRADSTLQDKTAPESVLWQPRLATNAEGQVALNITLPSEPGRYRLVIDAHGSGRLGTVVHYLDIAPPPVAEEAAPAN